MVYDYRLLQECIDCFLKTESNKLFLFFLKNRKFFTISKRYATHNCDVFFLQKITCSLNRQNPDCASTNQTFVDEHVHALAILVFEEFTSRAMSE